MKRKITQTLLLVCLMLSASLGIQAQPSFFSKNENNQKKGTIIKQTTPKVPFRLVEKIEAHIAKSPTLRRAVKNTEQKDVVLLDSVISETRCEHYEYNDYGWITSAKIYEWEDDAMRLNTDESYLLEYEFDEQGHCTYYGEFVYNADGTKGQETERVVTTWTGSRERTEKYYTIPDDWNQLEPTAEISYDKYGNYCLMIFYDWDDEKDEMILEQHWEMRFTGNVMEYYYTEEGYPDGMDFDEELFDLHCYYYVDYQMCENYVDETYYELYAYKIDKTTDGLTTTKTRYEIDLDEEYENDLKIDLDQLNSYWKFEEEEIITLTPSRNRYASVYIYESAYTPEDNVTYPEYRPEEEIEGMAVATHTTNEKLLACGYDFEWDEHERLVKYTHIGDEEEDKSTYTCTYHDDEYRVITLADFEEAWHLYWEDEADDRLNLMRGGFYGKVNKERMEYDSWYSECISDEYDANGKVLHYTENEVYYSDVEAGEDLNGDGVMSTEREECCSEYWFTYDAEGNTISTIEHDSYGEANRAYTKYVNINEPSGSQYLSGYQVYWGASKEGPWTLMNEEINVFDEDPSTAPNIEAVSGWWRLYEYNLDTWVGNKWEMIDGSYVEYAIDPQTGEFSTTGNASTPRRSEELQEGFYDIRFTEDGWVYKGHKNIGYVWDEEAEAEILKITDGEIRIFREGGTNGYYNATDPADNYEFPVGIYFMGVELEDVSESNVDMIWLVWDKELETWRMEFGMVGSNVYSHYTNEKSQIVNEKKTYVFNPETERMELQHTDISSIYSFDEFDRLSSIEYNAFTTHYTYRNDECNYLLESYMIDNATGNKYNVCKYYYNDGKYTFPNTDIEEIETTWTANGTSIMADGQIVLYNMNGQIAAQGWECVTAPQSGLYIVSFGETRSKVWLE